MPMEDLSDSSDSSARLGVYPRRTDLSDTSDSSARLGVYPRRTATAGGYESPGERFIPPAERVARFIPPRLRKGRRMSGIVQPGQRFLQPVQADEIPEEDAASDFGAPAPVPQRRRLTTKQSSHDRNLRRKIMPALRRNNFSLRKVGASRYIVSAKDVSHGVVEQVRALLKRIPGQRLLVDGRIFGKQSAFREIIRALNEKGSVEVSL